MNKKIFCLFLASCLLLTSFIPFASADCTLYASDGRTITVLDTVADAYREVGWYDTPEDARIITMYATDGRTIEIPNAKRDAFRAVGWYDTYDEVTVTMYATDGRTLTVYKDFAPAHKEVGWYYNLSDVSVKMYDTDGNEHTIFLDNVEDAHSRGMSENKKDVMQLMFAADGRTMYVKYADVEAYEKVGWYRGGGRIDPARPMVAITFDDGPGRYTDKILSCLEKYGAKATFFVQGKNVNGYKDTLARAVSLGCEIGNHTWSHVNLKNCSNVQISSQINSTNIAVFNATGVYPAVYRPPYGAYSSSIISSISMPAIMWSVDTLDWKTRNSEKTLQSVKANTRDGDIILMHDIHAPTADAVESVVMHLLKSGYQLVTVSELIAMKKGVAASGQVYNRVK